MDKQLKAQIERKRAEARRKIEVARTRAMAQAHQLIEAANMAGVEDLAAIRDMTIPPVLTDFEAERAALRLRRGAGSTLA